ncbi:uncharacterized protein F5147DRAFT_659750 [Suillus discolor]|uniref:Uncharacterized protein n=1 Tax=Suillus discolor TaxID=1912936 RepID=A0A9P7ERW2_9AGAM|nr:uncharacterized protein F5147DRAFT_659750 [Suillus discolor]KAG2084696.1 hypothetical protein F5147DRAFT_659750 [Suillus discolor]
MSEPLTGHKPQPADECMIGSNALQFLDRTFYDEADMDLYIHSGHAREVMDYVVEREGYEFKPHSKQPRDYRKLVSDKWDNSRLPLKTGTFFKFGTQDRCMTLM